MIIRLEVAGILIKHFNSKLKKEKIIEDSPNERFENVLNETAGVKWLVMLLLREIFNILFAT